MFVTDFLLSSADKYPHHDAVVYSGKRCNYEDLLISANSIARWLFDNDLHVGDRVAILSDNPYHYISCYFGILMAGGIVIGLNTQTSERSLTFYIEDATPSLVLASGRSKKYTMFLASLSSIDKVGDIDKLLANASDNSPNQISPVRPKLSPNDTAQIIYTSGTTGKPKGVMLSHENLVSNTLSTVEYLNITNTDKVMVVLPFFYSYGNSLLLTHVSAGGTLVVNQSFVYPNVILDQMVEEKVTGLSGVPSTFALLLHRSALKEYSFPDLRYLTQAGAAMSPTLADQLKQVFPECEIFIMYGQTEAAPRLSYLPPHDLHRKSGSIGIAIPGVQLEILKKDGSQADIDETGEIVASGNNIMIGYWNRPKETAEAIRDGKLWTGDLAYRDDEGYIYIISRKSDMIKSGSHRIAPKEIEEVLCEHSDIIEAAVLGADDEILGELIHAHIVLKENVQLSEKEIIKFCRKILPPFKVPHKVIYHKELPKSDTGKIQKSALKK